MSRFVVSVLAVAATCGSALAQIPFGFELVELANGSQYHSSPQLNNCGEIVFSIRLGPSWADAEIFLYDNWNLIQITDNEDRDVGPDINDQGTIVWGRGLGDAGATQVLHRQDGHTVILAEGTPERPAMCPVINNLGHVAWNVWDDTLCPAPADIMFYDGVTVESFVSNGFTNQSMRLNDEGQMVWTEYHNTCPWSVHWTSQIMLYTDGEITALPATPSQAQGPDINNQGDVLWASHRTIELWQSGEVTVLTDSGSNPKINDNGEIYFIRFHDDLGSWQPWLYRPEPQPTFYRLIDEPFWNADGEINNAGECAWSWRSKPGGPPMYGIRFMRRVRNADANFDDDVDLEDFAGFPDCLTGPVDTDHLCECRFLDLDHDRDVDLADFADFQVRFGATELSQDCCMPHEGPGCNDPEVEACVCDANPICCLDEWYLFCAQFAGYFCTFCP